MKAALITYFVLATVLLLVFGLLTYFIFPLLFKRIHSRKYSKLQEFPFEMIHAKSQYLPLGRFIIILSSAILFLASGFFLSSISLFPSYLGMAVMVVVFAGIASLGYAATYLIRADVHVKTHLFFFLIFGFGSALLDFANILALSHFPYERVGIKVMILTILVVTSLAKLVILLNPKLAHWPKMVSTMDENGAMSTQRPKVFVLAFSEWLLILLHYISSILGLVFFFISVLPLI